MKNDPRLALAALASAALACAGARARPAPDVLARVNDDAITVGQLRAEFTKRHGGHGKFLVGEPEIRQFLEKMIERSLLVQEAYRIGLDAQPDIREAEADAVARSAIARLVRIEVEDRAEPDDAEVKAIWETKLEDAVQVRQIVVATEAEAREIEAALDAGGDFEAIARERSLAPSAKYGGRVAPLGWGAMDPAWERIAFSLAEKERAAPFLGPSGWEILEVESRTKAPRPELDKARERIRSVLRARRMREREVAFVAELEARWHARTAAVDLSPAALRAARDGDGKAVAASWDGGELTVKAFADRVAIDALAALPAADAEARARAMLHDLVVDALLRREVSARGLDRAPEAVAAGRQRREDLMENRLYGEYVLKDVGATDAEVEAWYDAHRRELVSPERRRVAQILVETREQAAAVRERIANGEPFAAVARSESRDAQTRKMGGDLGLVEKAQVPPGFEAVFAAGEGEIVGPVESKLGWHVLLVAKVVPARPLALDEVRADVRRKLLGEKHAARRKEWIAELRAVSAIRVDARAVRRLGEEASASIPAPPPASPHGAGGP